ncbi:bcl-2-like protein 2 isoform X1 [Mytilus edulis]|uniref:bcl-2-like protein 2 isoform X1 n=1 Tax=Mytilus edulis TaxID=6550 RepID=UPI0039EEED20
MFCFNILLEYIFGERTSFAMENNTDQTGTRYLVVDYINYRLNNNGVQWDQCPSLLPQPLDVHRTLRKKGDEFEERFKNEFQNLIDELHITENTAYPMFCKVLEELFKGGINWGRIVALFSFGGSLATQCMKRDLPQLIDSVIEWITLYIEKNLSHWIQTHGGWQGFVEFYNQGQNHNDSPWDVKGLVKYGAIGVIGAMALSAFLQRT